MLKLIIALFLVVIMGELLCYVNAYAFGQVPGKNDDASCVHRDAHGCWTRICYNKWYCAMCFFNDKPVQCDWAFRGHQITACCGDRSCYICFYD